MRPITITCARGGFQCEWGWADEVRVQVQTASTHRSDEQQTQHDDVLDGVAVVAARQRSDLCADHRAERWRAWRLQRLHLFVLEIL